MEKNGKQNGVLMIRFRATIKKFGAQGEKTGWTYIEITEKLAQQMKPGNKKGFRVKGSLDKHEFEMASLLPMGGGDFILTLNAAMRKKIGKRKGDIVEVVMEADDRKPEPSPELMECLRDEPGALSVFQAMPGSHQNYYSNWIKAAKTDPTRARRIAAVIKALSNGWDFGQMLRSLKKEKDNLELK